MQYDKTWNGHKFVISTFGIDEGAFTIHGYVPDIPIDDFKDENGLIIQNVARTVDVPDSEIAKWTRIHEAEHYDDTIFCPPTFTTQLNKKKLMTGTCKTKGADGADNKTTIGAVHVSFHYFGGISAREWEEIARSNENRPVEENEYIVENNRTDIDVLGTLVSLYDKGSIQLSKTNKDGEDVPYDGDVNKRLKLLHIKESQWPSWRKKLYTELKVNTERIVRTVALTEKQIQELEDQIKKLYPGKRLLFKVMESGANIKYGIEIIREVLDARLDNSPIDIIVVKFNTIYTPETLFKTRKELRDFFTDPKGNFQKDIKRFESEFNESEKWPEMKFEPQTEPEIIEWKKKGDKLC